ncbi:MULTISPECIES: hypothetical protein [Pseudobutyrivibrio]|uniref:Uncharacterized protein n=1 Tax=Pseudobutyrivibrio xylanivorans TaxID=185007 RepID=A0A1G5S572_PSEXY|nr:MULTISPECIES: hypothetical protein [Pseudobutyrivibrio]MDC7278098.1 hypothetical protein [Butyrivibrio fibrisolvens]SCZ81307.1 hypothetical protein SAMN02910350_02750 [Pseudobutyrivibrio xylanivorans]
MLKNFKYQKVYEKGKPVHQKFDSFSIKHPAMDLSRRAKIFSPFDALKGFNEELAVTENESNENYLQVERIPMEEFP